MHDSLFLHCLGKISGVGAEKLRKIAAHFETFESAWDAPLEEFIRAGIPSKLAETIVHTRKHISPEREFETLEQHRVRLISRESENYPALLAEIPNPPALLYLRGDIDFNRRPMITLVGTRKPTEYGIGIAREFASELAKSGIAVISGMALGIDKAAHQGALDGGGVTIAVLGNGLDDASISPRTHLDLAHTISLHGALLSDYPPGTGASEGTFPARNRIMAGLSLGTVVIEASEKSGTLITANLALDFNREVFAVPGSIYSENSRGPHALIKRGAILTASLSDILDALPLSKERENREILSEQTESDQENISADEERLLKILGSDTMHIDALIKHSTLETSNALSALAFLEMKGLVKNIGNMHYIRTYRV
ncbi:MAG: DNA-protecting protein DprA [Candidatus Moraniibacteriota bacterium]|nr:MAG: DNA-protecting protein DprA [Candidatus Moranbacteria bacterium]